MVRAMERPVWVLVAAACAWAAAMVGCSGTAHVVGAGATPLVPRTEMALERRFPGASGLLEGVATATEPLAWRPGDRVLLGLTFVNGSNRTERLLLVELTSEPGERPVFRRRVDVFGEDLRIQSPTRAVVLGLYDEVGTLLSERPGQLAEVFLDHGPVEVARIGGGYAISTGDREGPRQNPRPEVTIEALTPSVYGMMSLLAFGDGAADNPMLAKLIQNAFTLSQQLKLLWTMGRFEIRFGQVERLGPGVEPVPGLDVGEAYDCEVRISVGGDEALVGRAVVAPTFAPLGLCGGIVAAELINVANPSMRAELVLLGAARGPTESGNETNVMRTGGAGLAAGG